MSYFASYDKTFPATIKVFTSVATAIKQGYAFCYNYDYGTAASADERRGFEVEKPSTANHMWFAGVAAKDYVANSSGQYIEIVPPGNYCYVYANASCTLGSTTISPLCGQHYFKYDGLPGAGRFTALQTVDRSSTAGLVWGYLEAGKQSGLTALTTPVDNDTMTGVITEGVNYMPATTLATGNSTYTLADGTHLDQEVAFYALGAMTTSDVVITVTTCYEGASYDVATIDAASEYLRARWNGKAWHVEGSVLS